MSGWGEDETDGGWGDSSTPAATETSGGGGGGSRNCFKCDQPGHRAKDCPTGGSGGGGGGGDKTCRKCNEPGHFARECPSGGGSGDANDGCRICKEVGHYAQDCPKKDACRRCGEDGHKAAECTQPETTRTVTVKGDDGEEKTMEIYVPQETTDTELFETGILAGINFEKYESIKIDVTGDNVPEPVKSFDQAGLRPLLLENIAKCNYKLPTPIQKQSIPIIMDDRDLMGCAQTGSGKTAAFLLPILHKMIEGEAESHTGEPCQAPQAVIITPTRELAVQIYNEARKFARGSMIKAVVAYGGTSTLHGRNQLSKGCNMLIATPGRLKDFVNRGHLDFSDLKYLVLDEADRMLDMGFSGDIQEIVGHKTMPAKEDRVTLMFSATFAKEVQVTAQTFLKDYIFLRVGIVGSACKDIDQTFVEVDRFKKKDALVQAINELGPNKKVMVFIKTKKNTDFIAAYLCSEGFKATSIHGDRLQRQREEALANFRRGVHPILVATDVAARGLDISGVDMVVNFDMPSSVDEYVHRIGRTGRMGNLGKAVSMFEMSQDSGIAAALVNILSDAEQTVPDFLAEAAKGGGCAAGLSDGGDIRATGGGNDDEDDW